MRLDDLVREWLYLDPESPTGLRWRKDTYNRVKRAGDTAFTAQVTGGYYSGRLRGKQMLAHRVVFFLDEGYWPAMVDHANGVVTDNRPCNLRDGSGAINQHNRVERGYYLHKSSGKYVAQITRKGKRCHLGQYTTPDEAHAAYLAAKRIDHPTAPQRCYGELH